MAKKVVVYTFDYCPYCDRAKSLLEERGIPFEEIRVSRSDEDLRDTLYKRSKMRTFPQIFCDDRLVGGYQELAEEDQKDRLASLQ